MEPVDPAFVAIRRCYRERESPLMKSLTYACMALLASTLLLSACANTIRGAGKDVANTVNATEHAGKRVAHAAK
jgi:entericidin B